MEQKINLYSSEWYDVDSPLIFFIGNKVRMDNLEVIDEIIDKLVNSQTLVIANYKETQGVYSFRILLDRYVIECIRTENDNIAFTSIRKFDEIKRYKLKDSIYNGIILNLVPRGKIMTILQCFNMYGKADFAICPEEFSNTDWTMEESALSGLDDKMKEHFENFSENEEKQRFKVGVKFRNLILDKFKNYTFYEDENEKYLALEGTSLYYTKRSATTNSSKFRNYTYQFYCPEFDKKSFHIDTRVSVESNITNNSDVKKLFDGVIIDIGLSEEETIVEISFSNQFNDREIPGTGRIFVQHNPVQRRVREKVLQDINRFKIRSTYMYNTFSNFQTAGYEHNVGWEEFEKTLDDPKEKFKPNESQKEAIRKGIETKDVQLVLGPPGTGKTTVIVAWIKYFVNHNMKVLVSSQNNMAVDNVIERAAKDSEINIIRIGNESKVKEEVKTFLPERRDQELYAKYKSAMDETKKQFDCDIMKLKELEGTIKTVREYLSEFQNVKSKLYAIYNQAASEMKKQGERHADILMLKEKMDATVEEIARKDIYLTATSNSSLLVRALRFIYTIGIKKSLAELKANFQSDNKKIKELIKAYNNEFVKIMESMQCVEADNAKQRYAELYEALEKYEKLQMEFSSPYDTIDCGMNFAVPGEAMAKLDDFRMQCEEAQNNIIDAWKALGCWDNELNEKRNEIMTNILVQSADVVGATCIGINSNRRFAGIDFDVAIIDEAGQIQVHNIIVPMTRAKKNLLLGDYKQIPPIVNDKVAKLCEANGVKTDLLEKSFFEFLFEKCKLPEENKSMLKWQFRMPAEIADIISHEFYKDQYYSLESKRGMKSLLPTLFKSPLVVLNTSECNRRHEKSYPKGGYYNPYEAEIVEKIMCEIFKEGTESHLKPSDIGIIAPYNKQVQYLKKSLKSKLNMFSAEEIDGMIASLDSFQGQERKLIIYSSTRSNDKETWEKRIGFLNELRRLNVAFTRCQEQLVIIGDMDFLSTCEYMQKDEDGNENYGQNEKKFSSFIKDLVSKVKSGSGEFLDSVKFLQERMR